jgi:hypothetical protein
MVPEKDASENKINSDRSEQAFNQNLLQCTVSERKDVG